MAPTAEKIKKSMGLRVAPKPVKPPVQVTVVRTEVRGATNAPEGTPVNVEAWAIFSNNTERNVTEHAQFSSSAEAQIWKEGAVAWLLVGTNETPNDDRTVAVSAEYLNIASAIKIIAVSDTTPEVEPQPETVLINDVTVSENTVTITASKANTDKELEYTLGTIYQQSNVFYDVPNGTHAPKVRLVGSQITSSWQNIQVNYTPPVVERITGKLPYTGKSAYNTSNLSINKIKNLFDGSLVEAIESYQTWADSENTIVFPFRDNQNFDCSYIRMRDGAGDSGTGPGIEVGYIDINNTYVYAKHFTGKEHWDGWINFFNFNAPTRMKAAVMKVNGTSAVFPREIEFYGDYDNVEEDKLVIEPAMLAAIYCLVGYWYNYQNPKALWNQDRTLDVIDETRYEAVKSFHRTRLYYPAMEYIRATDKVVLQSGATLYPPRTFRFMGSPQGGFSMKLITERAKADGGEIMLCLNGNFEENINTYADPKSDDAIESYVAAGADKTLPSSYFLQMEAGGEIAAAFGSVVYPLDRLNQATVQQNWWEPPVYKFSGINTVKYLQLFNEMNKKWKGFWAYMNAKMTVAALSALYDCDQGRMAIPGRILGVKTTDPNMKVVIGPTYFPDPSYYRAMVEAARELRGYKADGITVDVPWDDVSFHGYNREHPSNYGVPFSLADERDNYFELLRAIQETTPGVGIHQTEHGYAWMKTTNANQPGNSYVPDTSTRSTHQRIGDYHIQHGLHMARLGLKGAHVYQLEDDSKYNMENWDQWCGVKGRPAEYYIKQTRDISAGYTLAQQLSNPDPLFDNSLPYVDKYTKPGAGNLYTLWGVGPNKDYSLNLPQGGVKYILQDASYVLFSEDLAPGTHNITVFEKSTIIVANV